MVSFFFRIYQCHQAAGDMTCVWLTRGKQFWLEDREANNRWLKIQFGHWICHKVSKWMYDPKIILILVNDLHVSFKPKLVFLSIHHGNTESQCEIQNRSIHVSFNSVPWLLSGSINIFHVTNLFMCLLLPCFLQKPNSFKVTIWTHIHPLCSHEGLMLKTGAAQTWNGA